ncbi:MAG: hypothetical protein MRJ65_05685 [Candidatus Brocadiaceae bacterium]|nr:hypothetical protein [Candidatus Brocadiaceae bacterium]
MPYKPVLPDSFSMVKNGGTTFFVREGYCGVIRDLQYEDLSFPDKRACKANTKVGRARYLSIPLGDKSGDRLIIRSYRHGGLFGKLFGGIFFNTQRPLNELSINEIALRKGVPSAEVIAVTKKNVWGCFYTANFISKEVSGAIDLIQFFKESSSDSIQKHKKSILYTLAKLVRKMHDAGIYHADLHLKNILLKQNPNGEFHAYIIDLDKSVVFPNLSIGRRIKNLLRLDRSLEKLRWFSDEASASKKNLISKTDRIRFFKSYMLYNKTIDRDWKKSFRRYRSHHVSHKLWWRVLRLSRKRKPFACLKVFHLCHMFHL